MPSPTPRLPPQPDARRRLLRLAGATLPARAPLDAPVRRVLLIRPDHIGDVLLTSPAIARLRHALPSTELTYLVGPWSADVARRGPPVDHLETLSFPGFTRQPKGNVLQPYTLLAREAARLRHVRFDAAIVLRPDHWWGALLARASDIPVRIGYDLPDTGFLLTHALALDPSVHAAEQSLALADYAIRILAGRDTDDVSKASSLTVADRGTDVGATPAFAVTEADTVAAARLLAAYAEGAEGAGRGAADPRAGDRRRRVAIQPSAGAPLKSWPVPRWAALVDRLIDAGHAVVLVGGPDDGALLATIADRTQHAVPCFAGQSLGVTAAIYAACALVVGVDGGGLHLAAALGTPTVRLYGPAPPSIFGPWPATADQRVLVAQQLDCVPCGVLEAPPCGATHLPVCMLAVSVEAVLETAQTALRTNKET